ncbi:MAG: stage V sporulation protein AA [Lachnospiraceae bacterium]|nr:stage V sporulation protein AA [Lachnospiraceae bacterium]
MIKKLVYIKADQNVKVSREKVYLQDVFKIITQDSTIKDKLNLLLIYDFSNKNTRRAVISILEVIQIIQGFDPTVEIVSLGENDIVLELVEAKKSNAFLIGIKVLFVSLICFFGTAFTLMAFHNDINIVGLLENIYNLFGIAYQGGVGPLELGYSIGLGVGIIVFYNHIGKRRITKDPTPLEVEMRIYENDVNKTLIENATREGLETDVP